MFKLFSNKTIVIKIVISNFILILLIFMVECSPPQDPIKCSNGTFNCTIKNTYGMFPDRSICRAAEVVYPSTEAELISIVANATLLKRKIKAATSTSHSLPKLVCPDGENGLIISTKNLDQAINVDQSGMTMTVGSGMTLRELISKAAEAGLALPYVPYWWGLTVGGLLGTGAHGSSLWGLGSAVHGYVVQLRIVTPAGSEEGYAKLRILEIDDPELNAAKVSLGVLGVISQVPLDTITNLASIFIYYFLSSLLSRNSQVHLSMPAPHSSPLPGSPH